MLVWQLMAPSRRRVRPSPCGYSVSRTSSLARHSLRTTPATARRHWQQGRGVRRRAATEQACSYGTSYPTNSPSAKPSEIQAFGGLLTIIDCRRARKAAAGAKRLCLKGVVQNSIHPNAGDNHTDQRNIHQMRHTLHLLAPALPSEQLQLRVSRLPLRFCGGGGFDSRISQSRMQQPVIDTDIFKMGQSSIAALSCDSLAPTNIRTCLIRHLRAIADSAQQPRQSLLLQWFPRLSARQPWSVC
jgi:hypothetical protein